MTVSPSMLLARWRVRLGFLVGVLALVLARPTARSVVTGGAIACVGEMLRIWAAGHLEKGREVTRSGPYHFIRHPLYFGSALMGLGVIIASNHAFVAGSVLAYLATTLTAAMRSEEHALRGRFGAEYDAYANGSAPPVERRFSLERAWRNREYRAAAGLGAMVLLLAAKAWWGGQLN